VIQLQLSEKLQEWLDFYIPYTKLNRWDYQSLHFHSWDKKHKDVIACVRNGQSVTLEPHVIFKSLAKRRLICSLILTIYSLTLYHSSNSMDLRLLCAPCVLHFIIYFCYKTFNIQILL